MNFKKSKQDLGDAIYNAVSGEVYSRLSALHGQPMTGLGPVIAEAIACGARKAVEILMENTYTDQEFEEDIGLREKNETKR